MKHISLVVFNVWHYSWSDTKRFKSNSFNSLTFMKLFRSDEKSKFWLSNQLTRFTRIVFAMAELLQRSGGSEERKIHCRDFWRRLLERSMTKHLNSLISQRTWSFFGVFDFQESTSLKLNRLAKINSFTFRSNYTRAYQTKRVWILDLFFPI